MQMVELRAHSRYDLLCYSLLAFPLAFAGLPIYIHAPDFYTTEFNVSLTSLGLILLVMRMIDAAQDPLIGFLSDKYRQFFKFTIGFGIILLALGFWFLFHPNAEIPLLWFSVSTFLCATGFSIVSINFQSLGSLWKSDTEERTRITGWREAIGLIGLLFASILPSGLMSFTDSQTAFHLISLIFLPVLCLVGVFFFNWINKATFIQSCLKVKTKTSSMFSSRWNLGFFTIFFFNSIASSIPAVLVLFFIRDRLEAQNLTGLFLFLYFTSGVIFMPVWHKIACKNSKTKAWLVSMIVATLTFVWASILAKGDIISFGIICVLSGASLGADLALPPSIIADHIVTKNDPESASKYFSILTFLTKFSLAVSTGLMFPILDYLGYSPNTSITYSDTQYLAICYALVPCFIKFVVFILTWRFIKKFTL